jgi:hypothetical protein
MSLLHVSVDVRENKLGAIDLLIRTFCVFVGIYRQIRIGLVCSQREISYKNLFGDGTCSCENAGFGALWVFVRVS